MSRTSQKQKRRDFVEQHPPTKKAISKAITDHQVLAEVEKEPSRSIYAIAKALSFSYGRTIKSVKRLAANGQVVIEKSETLEHRDVCRVYPTSYQESTQSRQDEWESFLSAAGVYIPYPIL